ncbi:MAG: hypothetical protein ABGX04_18950 [Myxococcales bacterium]
MSYPPERVAACAEAAASLDFPFMLTARAEGLLRQVNVGSCAYTNCSWGSKYGWKCQN